MALEPYLLSRDRLAVDMNEPHSRKARARIIFPAVLIVADNQYAKRYNGGGLRVGETKTVMQSAASPRPQRHIRGLGITFSAAPQQIRRPA
jgi:hypothetical protein